jgi:septum formation protein
MLLANAGVDCAFDKAAVDEEELKASFRNEGTGAAEVAEALAELKARHVSRRHPGALVIGADQMLDCEGTWFDKPPDMEHAAGHLRALSGRTHSLLSAVCVVRDDQRLWHHVEAARLTMRELSEDFIAGYLAAAGEEVCGSVGAYQLEGRGAQLFERIEGDYFTILGLPLLPLLDFLRNHGAVPR